MTSTPHTNSARIALAVLLMTSIAMAGCTEQRKPFSLADSFENTSGATPTAIIQPAPTDTPSPNSTATATPSNVPTATVTPRANQTNATPTPNANTTATATPTANANATSTPTPTPQPFGFTDARGIVNVTNVATSAILQNTTWISWTTPQLANSRINYWINTTTAWQSMSDGGLQTSHNFSLTGLFGNTTYEFNVVSCNSYNVCNQSGNYSFKTIITDPAIILSYAVERVNSSYATITWVTDVNSTDRVFYSDDALYNSWNWHYNNTQDNVTSADTRFHNVTLTGLNHSTTYHFLMRSCGYWANCGNSTDHTFTTSAITPATGITANYGATTAFVAWNTANTLNSSIELLTAALVSVSNTTNGTRTTHHNTSLTGLTVRTTYKYRVWNCDDYRNCIYSTAADFTTTDNTPPTITQPAAAPVTASAASISWLTSKNSNATIYYGTASGTYSAAATNATFATNENTTLTGLASATTYYYVAMSCDDYNNCANSTEASFTTT